MALHYIMIICSPISVLLPIFTHCYYNIDSDPMPWSLQIRSQLLTSICSDTVCSWRLCSSSSLNSLRTICSWAKVQANGAIHLTHGAMSDHWYPDRKLYTLFTKKKQHCMMKWIDHFTSYSLLPHAPQLNDVFATAQQQPSNRWTFHCKNELLKMVGRVWHIGRVDAFRPKDHGLDSRSSRHIGTLGKSLTHNCLWHIGMKFQHSIRAVLEVPLTRNGLEEALYKWSEWMNEFQIIQCKWILALSIRVKRIQLPLFLLNTFKDEYV